MKREKVICSVCGRKVGQATQPKERGAKSEYRVAWHRYQNDTCVGTGRPLNTVSTSPGAESEADAPFPEPR